MDLTNNPNMIYVEETVNDTVENTFTVESLDEDNIKTNVVLQIKTMICYWR